MGPGVINFLLSPAPWSGHSESTVTMAHPDQFTAVQQRICDAVVMVMETPLIICIYLPGRLSA